MDRRVRIAVAIMEHNFRAEVSLDVLARSVSLSRSRFQHLFKAETGMTPVCYLRALRLERSREMLAASLLSVKEVMASVGIRDKSHFTREFRKVYGVTPTEYRVTRLLRRGEEAANSEVAEKANR